MRSAKSCEIHSFAQKRQYQSQKKPRKEELFGETSRSKQWLHQTTEKTRQRAWNHVHLRTCYSYEWYRQRVFSQSKRQVFGDFHVCQSISSFYHLFPCPGFCKVTQQEAFIPPKNSELDPHQDDLGGVKMHKTLRTPANSDVMTFLFSRRVLLVAQSSPIGLCRSLCLDSAHAEGPTILPGWWVKGRVGGWMGGEKTFFFLPFSFQLSWVNHGCWGWIWWMWCLASFSISFPLAFKERPRHGSRALVDSRWSAFQRPGLSCVSFRTRGRFLHLATKTRTLWTYSSPRVQWRLYVLKHFLAEPLKKVTKRVVSVLWSGWSHVFAIQFWCCLEAWGSLWLVWSELTGCECLRMCGW